MDRFQAAPESLYVAGNFGTDRSKLRVWHGGKEDSKFVLVNSNLLVLRPAALADGTEVEVVVQLGNLTHSARFYGQKPSTDPSILFVPLTNGPQGQHLYLNEKRDLRPDGAGGIECWGSSTEVYRIIDYNRMIAGAYGILPDDPNQVGGSRISANKPSGNQAPQVPDGKQAN